MQPTDARLHVFDSAREATAMWIKGEGFTVGKLLGSRLAKRLELDGCSLVISRCRYSSLAYATLDTPQYPCLQI